MADHASDIAGGSLIFRGTGGSECEDFIRNVRHRAFSQDKQNDDRWLAGFAATALSGAALRWYEDCPDEVQESWKLLRKALLMRWPADGDGQGSSSVTQRTKPSNVPTPAAAAPTIANLTSSLSNLSLDSFKGRIRIIDIDNGSPLGYVSRNATELGHFHVTTNNTDALKVEFSQSEKPHPIKITNPTSEHRWLAFQWMSANPLLERSSRHWGVLLAMDSTSKTTATSSAAKNGADCQIWTTHLGGAITASWNIADTMGELPRWTSLQAIVCKQDTEICFCVDYEPFIGPPNQYTWWKARLVFEPL